MIINNKFVIDNKKKKKLSIGKSGNITTKLMKSQSNIFYTAVFLYIFYIRYTIYLYIIHVCSLWFYFIYYFIFYFLK